MLTARTDPELTCGETLRRVCCLVATPRPKARRVLLARTIAGLYHTDAVACQPHIWQHKYPPGDTVPDATTQLVRQTHQRLAAPCSSTKSVCEYPGTSCLGTPVEPLQR